jgi:K319-like protein
MSRSFPNWMNPALLLILSTTPLSSLAATSARLHLEVGPDAELGDFPSELDVIFDAADFNVLRNETFDGQEYLSINLGAVSAADRFGIGFYPRPGDFVGIRAFSDARENIETRPWVDLAWVHGSAFTCDREAGRYQVSALTIEADDSISELAVDFEFTCNGLGQTEFRTDFDVVGSLRIDSGQAMDETVLEAATGWQHIGSPGETIELDGTWSYAGTSEIVDYAWAQTGGLAVTLSAGSSGIVSFVAPDVVDATRNFEFELTVTDAAGDSDTIVVPFEVVPDGEPRDRMYGFGPPESDVGLFGYYDEDDIYYNNLVSAPHDADLVPQGLIGVTMGFSGPGLNVPLTTGTYDSAEIASFGDQFEPRFRGPFAYGCFQGTEGWFRVHEITYDGNWVSSLAVDTVQTSCTVSTLEGDVELLSSPIVGQYRYNSSVPIERDPVFAYAGRDRVADGADAGEVFLMGNGGVVVPDDAQGIQWVQTGGPTVQLVDASALDAGFIIPPVAGTGVTLTFELQITDADGVVYSDELTVQVLGSDVPRLRTVTHIQPDGYGLIRSGTYSNLEDNTYFDTVDAPGSYYALVGDGGDADIRFQVSMRDGSDPVVGFYELASSGTAILDLDLTVDSTTCRPVDGWLEIHEVEIVGGELTLLAADFEGQCDDPMDRDTRSQVRFNSTLPITLRPPVAVYEGPFYWTEHTTIEVSAAGSYRAGGSITDWEWRIPSTNLVRSNGADANFLASEILDFGIGPIFLTVTDDEGYKTQKIISVVTLSNGIEGLAGGSLLHTLWSSTGIPMQVGGYFTRLDPVVTAGRLTVEGSSYDMPFGAVEMEWTNGGSLSISFGLTEGNVPGTPVFIYQDRDGDWRSHEMSEDSSGKWVVQTSNAGPMDRGPSGDGSVDILGGPGYFVGGSGGGSGGGGSGGGGGSSGGGGGGGSMGLLLAGLALGGLRRRRRTRPE